MNEKYLDNIFRDRQTRTVYGTVKTRISARRFKVETDSGKTVIVDSDTDWGLETQVIVQNGFIIGTGKRAGTYREYQV